MAYGEGIIAPTAIFLAAMIIVYNCASVIVLVAPHAGQGKRAFDFVKMGKDGVKEKEPNWFWCIIGAIFWTGLINGGSPLR